MKHRTPFLLWIILFHSITRLYAVDCTTKADSLYNLGNTYAAQAQENPDHAQQKLLNKKAIDAYSNAFAIAIELTCNEQLSSLKHADFAYKLGVKAVDLALNDEAITLFNLALKIRIDSLDRGHNHIVKCYANLSQAYRNKLNFAEAETMLRLGFAELDAFDGTPGKIDKIIKAYLYYHGAQLYIDKGDPYRAFSLNTVSWNLFTSIKQYTWQVNAGNQRGVIFEKIKEYKQGIAHLKKLEKLSIDSANSQLIHKIHQGLGNMYYLEGSFDNAIKYYQLAMNEAGSDLTTFADCQGNIGLIYLQKGQFEQAEAQYLSAIQHDLPNTDIGIRRTYLSNNYAGLGEVYQEMHKFQDAIQAYQKSLSFLVSEYPEEDIYALPDFRMLKKIGSLRFLIESLTGKAQTLFQKYMKQQDLQDLNAAGETYFLAIQLIDELRINYEEDQSKLFLMNDVYSTYEGAIQVAKYQGNPGFAFQLAEKAKATLLYASMMDKEAKSFANIPPQALTQEEDLKREISILEQKKDALTENGESDPALLDELLAKKRELQALIEEFGQKYPEYYRLKYDTELVNVAEIQEKLPDSTLMIEYFAGNHSWFIFSISKTDIQITEIASQKAEINEFAELVPQTESWGREIPKAQKELFDCLGVHLYQQLMQTFMDSEELKYAIIIPDREIYYLPFDVLLTQAPNEKLPISVYPFLLKDLAISYDFSAKLWLKGISKKSSAGWFQRSLLAFAPDFTEKAPESLSLEEKGLLNLDFFKGRSEPDSLDQLNPLTESKDEVRVIRDLLGGSIYPDNDKLGLLGRFIKEAPKYRFIHLGTHGVFNKYNSKYSYLAFQPVDDDLDNERLYLTDLYNLNLDAEMVVLSACETQAGELLPGEGIASLAQGFTYAGARSIVATLWSVQNASNSELMKRFYEHLIDGDNKALALQKAKISMNKEGLKYGPPFYWAAPNVIGSTAPIHPPSPWKRYLLISMSLLLVGGIGMFFLQKRKVIGK